MVAQASRTRVFTVTWSTYAPDVGSVDGTRGSRKDRAEHTGPFCKVTIQVVPASTGVDTTLSSETAVDAVSDNGREKTLEFLEHSMPLRSYNSVSLAKDGIYSITLSDCHGTISSSLTRTASVLPSNSENPGHRPQRDWRPNVEESGGGSSGGKDVRDGPALATGRILFAPLPVSIDFRVEAGQVTGGETTVGNFHLLPISHAPQGAEPSLCAVGSNREGTGVRDFGHGQEPILASGNGGGVDRNDQPCAWECGDGRGWAPSCPYSGGCFVSGAATGVLLYLLLTWLVTVRGYGKTSWERWCNWLKVGNEWREAAIGEERGGKKRGLHVIDDGEQSDDGSSDSDTILNGNMPEPVGLPRSDEDWRALFDTLYEDQAIAEAAEARPVASCTSLASDGAKVKAGVKVDAAENSTTAAATDH